MRKLTKQIMKPVYVTVSFVRDVRLWGFLVALAIRVE